MYSIMLRYFTPNFLLWVIVIAHKINYCIYWHFFLFFFFFFQREQEKQAREEQEKRLREEMAKLRKMVFGCEVRRCLKIVVFFFFFCLSLFSSFVVVSFPCCLFFSFSLSLSFSFIFLKYNNKKGRTTLPFPASAFTNTF